MSAISATKKSLPHTRTAGSDQHKLPKVVNPIATIQNSQEAERHSSLSLATRLERTGPLSLESVLRIFTGVAAALEKAHDLGTIHGGISPSMILIRQDETGKSEIVRLADFSATIEADKAKSKSMGKSRSKKDSAALCQNTGPSNAHYISPEQAIGGSVDCRTDIYSTGCALFEALTGKPPFAGESETALIEMHINEAPPLLPASLTDSRAGKRMQMALSKMLHKNREMRFQSATALLNTLKDISSLLSEHKDPTEAQTTEPAKEAAEQSLIALSTAPKVEADGASIAPVAPIVLVAPVKTDSESTLNRVDSDYEWTGTPADYCSRTMAAILTLMFATTVMVWITLKVGPSLTLPHLQTTAVVSH